MERSDEQKTKPGPGAGAGAKKSDGWRERDEARAASTTPRATKPAFVN